MDWQQRFNAEMRKAEQSRARGNEGRARVCARRAAGIVAAEFYLRRGLAHGSSSAMDALQQLRLDTSLSPDLTPPLDHLVQSVDTEFKLPPGIDLIAEARRLREYLLPD